MINTEKIYNLIHSEGWKEFKKIVEAERLKLTRNIIDKPKESWEIEIARIKAMEEMIIIPENIVKKEKIKKSQSDVFWDLPDTLD